jgi:hypothetical protein
MAQHARLDFRHTGMRRIPRSTVAKVTGDLLIMDMHPVTEGQMLLGPEPRRIEEIVGHQSDSYDGYADTRPDSSPTAMHRP